MTFDINTAVGHWPFRRIPHQTPSELRALLEKAGIDGAAVANTNGLFYKNCHDANLELADWLAPHADFFVGVATLNPLYAAWERDLRTCSEELGFRALRLAPQYHDYALGCGESIAIARLAAQAGLPLLIPHRVVDVRQHHWLDTEQVIGIDEIGALCRGVPEARVIACEGKFSAGALVDGDGSPRYPGLYLESSRVDIDAFPEEFAAAQIAFGTGAPFKQIRPAQLKVEVAGLEPASRERICGQNGRELLGLG